MFCADGATVSNSGTPALLIGRKGAEKAAGDPLSAGHADRVLSVRDGYVVALN